MRLKTISQTPHKLFFKKIKHFHYSQRALRANNIFSQFLYPLIKLVNTKQNI